MNLRQKIASVAQKTLKAAKLSALICVLGPQNEGLTLTEPILKIQ